MVQEEPLVQELAESEGKGMITITSRGTKEQKNILTNIRQLAAKACRRLRLEM